MDLNLAYRWFCWLGLEGDVPDHSTFSKNRHGRFRENDLLRELVETSVRRCIAEGLVGGEDFAVNASLIRPMTNEPVMLMRIRYEMRTDDGRFSLRTPATQHSILHRTREIASRSAGRSTLHRCWLTSADTVL